MIFPFGQRLDWKHLFGRTWKVLYTDGSGDPQELALGAANTILISNGASAAPSFAAPAWPVGSIFVSVVATNPNTLLGYGTWAAFGTGRMLVGIDAAQTEFDTVKETGGAKTVTLTSAEMPAHTHTQDAHGHTQDAHSHVLTELRDATTGGATTAIAVTSDTSSTLGTKTTGSSTATNQNTTPTNQNTGSGGAHANLPPYIVVYIWERTV